MPTILVLNRPNQNLLGAREPAVYGTTLHEAGRTAGETLGGAFNAGACTHTSGALGDAIKTIAGPVIEVHLSNVLAREPFRHHSYLSPACAGIVVGFGVAAYALAIDGLAHLAAARAAAKR